MTEIQQSEAGGLFQQAAPATVAIVMSTYNRAHLIAETIDSILAQSQPPDELIVVNDGSTDDTAAVLASYGQRISYLEKTNGGKSSALNFALPRALSDYICVFDDDDIMLPDAIETHMAFLAGQSEYDFSYGPNYAFQASEQIATITRGMPKAMPVVPAERFFLWMMESPFLPTPMQGMMIPAACFQQVGPFDPDLARSQDRDMVMRLARRFRAGRIDRPLWALREHAGVRGPGFDQHDESERYAVWWRYKHRVFAKLRESLTLEEYLVPSLVPALDDPQRDRCIRRRGLLQRSIIMATHGLLDQALADFSTYCDLARQDATRPDQTELQQTSQLSHVQSAETMPSRGFYETIGGLSRSHSALFVACIRGLYWSWRRDLARKQLRSSLRIAAAAASLCAGRARLTWTNQNVR